MTVVGKYELVGLIGRGGMGEVWQARDTVLDRVVALKLLQRAGGVNLERFRREASLTAKLNHPHVAQVFEHADAYIAMQFVEGVPIDDWAPPAHSLPETSLRRRGRSRQLEGKVSALRDAARAVQYAHDRGVLHRDLKPANILVDGSGHSYVLDFGLARDVRADEAGARMSLTGDILGSPSFMSPEQARGHVRQVDRRSDVYGLGATLYAMLAGTPPFSGNNPYEVIHRVIEEDPPAPGGDRDLQTICLKAMDREPARRYARAGDFADDLDRWLQGESIQARPPTLFYRMRRRIARQPLVWSLAALLAVSIVGGTVFGFAQLRIRLEEQRRANEQLETRERLERTGRRLGDLHVELAGAIGDERLAVVYGELDRIAREPPGTEPRAFAFLRGEALRFRSRVEDAIDEYTAALEAPETSWSRANQIAGRAALSRARARLTRVADLMAGFDDEERARRRDEAQALIDEVKRDLGAAADAGLPPGMGEVAALWADYATEDYGSAEAGATAGIGRGGDTAEFFLIRAMSTLDRSGNKDLEESLARVRAQPLAWRFLGERLANQGDREGAIAAYTEALRYRSNELASRFNRADLYRMVGEYDAAVEDLNRVLEEYPELAPAYNNRALAFSNMGDHEAALADFDRAVNVEERPLFLTNRAVTRQTMGDLPGAVGDCTRALQLASDDPAALAIRGRTYADLGDTERASADLTRFLQLYPSHPSAPSLRSLHDSLQ